MKEWREMWNGPKRTIYSGVGFWWGPFIIVHQCIQGKYKVLNY